MEIGWTVLPALLLVVFGVLSVGRIFDLSDEPDNAYHITVIGHQWWWEYHYPQSGETALSPSIKVVTDPDTGTVTAGRVIETDPVIVTAGELHIPTQTNIRLTIVAENRGNGGRHNCARDSHPLDLPTIAFDRRPPLGGDLELRQRALDADGTAWEVDAVNVR